MFLELKNLNLDKKKYLQKWLIYLITEQDMYIQIIEKPLRYNKLTDVLT